MTREAEVRAAGRLAGDGLGGLVGIVGEVHRAVAGRVERRLAPAGVSPSRTTRPLSGYVYATVELGLRAAAAVGSEVLVRRGGPEAPAPSQTPGGRALQSVVNGLWGDHIEEHHPAVAVAMSTRVDGEPTGHLVVFLHGLAESDEVWRLGHDPHDPDTTPYGDRLRDAHERTPVYLRYNAGLRVRENGSRASELLEALVGSWAVPVESISLVGHSMGGLVARYAAHEGHQRGAAWVQALRTVITLGTPHLGAPLAGGADAVHRALQRVPEVEPLSRVLGSRSVGVHDLHHGSDVPFVDSATYYFVAATLTRDARHPAGVLLGDGLVRYPSASGRNRTRHIGFEINNGAHVTGVTHLGLLNNSDVYPYLRRWLVGEEER